LGTDRQSEALLQAVNAAIHLRRPLLVRGEPGTGKTSLAYALAQRLQLGPVLHWRITSRSRLVDGLYRYDALGMLQDLQRDDFLLRRQGQQQPIEQPREQPRERPMADYISLGPVGTAFLPSLLPRVLLIDEIDKADPQLPNELLHLFEEGEFDIPELTRERRHQSLGDPKAALKPWTLVTADLVRAILRDEQRVLTVSRQQPGGVVLSMPAVVGRQGAVTLLDLQLDAVEAAALLRTTAVLQQAWDGLGIAG
jgi:MoxR-like ATPase